LHSRRERDSISPPYGGPAVFLLFNFLAGRAGFEPAVESLSPDNRLAGGPDRPLWHLPDIHLLKLPKGSQAEGEGFEPTVSFPTLVFKTSALSHSAIPPWARFYHISHGIVIIIYPVLPSKLETETDLSQPDNIPRCQGSSEVGNRSSIDPCSGNRTGIFQPVNSTFS
jgi:hypothetical protein